MSKTDPNCVYVGDSRSVAELVAGWLTERGFHPDVVVHMKESDGVGLSPLNDSDSTSHIEVHIENVDKAEEARELIRSHAQELVEEAKKADTRTMEKVVVECEECEKSNVYPGELQGTVQECEYCGSYLDVPGGEDEYDWSGVEDMSEEDVEEQPDEERDAWG